jgi:hypothetical protein
MIYLQGEMAAIASAPDVPNARHVILKEIPEELFISYSHEDEKLKNELLKHLSPLRRFGLIQEWHDRLIGAGADWHQEIGNALNRCKLILLLISADFINSDYCYGVEMTRAIDRHESGEARMIPIILRPCRWDGLPFGKYQALPEYGKAVTSWSNQDEAFTDIASGISKTLLSRVHSSTEAP